MACCLHLELFQEEAVRLGLEREAVKRNASFQVVDIIAREVGIQLAGYIRRFVFIRQMKAVGPEMFQPRGEVEHGVFALVQE